MAHVSVRTLRHYGAVGLLAPAARTEAGYRLYTAADVTRLYRILALRWTRYRHSTRSAALLDERVTLADVLARRARGGRAADGRRRCAALAAAGADRDVHRRGRAEGRTAHGHDGGDGDV